MNMTVTVEDHDEARLVGEQIEAIIRAHADYLEETRKLAAMLPVDVAIVFEQAVELRLYDHGETLMLEIPDWHERMPFWELQKPAQKEDAG